MAGVLTVKIVGESRDAIAAIDHVEGRLGRLSGVASGVGRAVAVGAAAAATGVVAAAGFAVASIKSASDLAETVSKSNVIFGEQAAAQMRGLADGAVTALGLSERAYLEYASGYGNMLVSIGGLTQAAAAKQSADLLTLTADIASFNNATNDEVYAAINSALTGEFEPLKKYGVVINDVTLKAKALELGLYEGAGALTAQAKQAATTALIFEQTSTAQGDFARTSEGAANQSKILAAQFENLKSDLGQKLLPVAVKALGFLNDIFPKIAAVAGPALDELIGGVKAFIAQFKSGNGDITSGGFAGQLEQLGFKVRQFVDRFREAWPRIKEIIGGIVDGFKEAMPTIREVAGVIAGVLVSAVQTLAPKMVTLAEGIGRFVGFLRDNKTLVLGALTGIAAGLAAYAVSSAVAAVAGFTYAGSALAAAAATALAALPFIALGVAIAALAAGLIWAYQNVDWFRTAVDAVASFLRDVAWPIIKTVAVAIGETLVAAIQGAAGFFTGTLVPAVSGIIGWFGDLIAKAIEVHQGIKDGFDTLVGFVTGLPGRIASAASGMFDGIKDAFRSALNWIIGKWNDLSFSLPSANVPGLGSIGGFTLDTPDIRKFHEGGIVPGRYGQEVLILAEAGETVRTREQEAALGRGVHIEHFHAADRPLLEEFEELQARYGVLV